MRRMVLLCVTCLDATMALTLIGIVSYSVALLATLQGILIRPSLSILPDTSTETCCVARSVFVYSRPLNRMYDNNCYAVQSFVAYSGYDYGLIVCMEAT